MEAHACLDPDCSERRLHALAEQRYCIYHECHEDGCVEKATGYQFYCTQFHACLAGTVDCLDGRSHFPAGTKFCRKHQCKYLDLGAESRDPGGFCADLHACRELQCRNPGIGEEAEQLCIGHCKESVQNLRREIARSQKGREELSNKLKEREELSNEVKELREKEKKKKN